jgi:photosystem II stability/assembly factor-like uncharacterized protein
MPKGLIMKKSWLLQLLIVFVSASISTAAFAQTRNVHHVSGRTPVQGVSRELAADRPSDVNRSSTHAHLFPPSGNHWKLQATLPGTIIHDMSFPTAKIGYAAAEAGQVWKTTDGGAHWKEILNLSYPWYWYGVDALNAKDVVISGFYDTSTVKGIIRWSHDGGATWTDDITVTPTGWGQRVRFPNSKDGLVMDLIDGATNSAQYTTDGGQAAPDWTNTVSNTDGGWFGLEFSFLKNLHARASGINFCDSTNGGAAWTCGAPVDSVFDGPVFFANEAAGWVGGGEISPNVEGWLHRTANGGKTWSGRKIDGPWPIREILFVTPKVGWATGGNLYTNVGGIYFTRNGGKTWSVDANIGSEMDACASRPIAGKFQVWCAGYNGSLTGVIYTRKGVSPNSER